MRNTRKPKEKRVFWEKWDDLVHRVPRKEYLFVLMGANTHTDRREGGCR